MIAVDTSALMAVVLGEHTADGCMDVLEAQRDVLISAATVAEALIVAERRGVAEEMSALIDGLALTVVAVSEASSRRVADAYAQWGKGVHPAGLNFGDCFAYAVAKEHDCPLLYVGGDFEQTDLRTALAANP